jgi:hypothetical protein
VTLLRTALVWGTNLACPTRGRRIEPTDNAHPNAMHFSCRGVRRRRATQQVRYPARLRRAYDPVSYKCGLGGGLGHPSTAGEPPEQRGAGVGVRAPLGSTTARRRGPHRSIAHRPGRPLREPRGAGPRAAAARGGEPLDARWVGRGKCRAEARRKERSFAGSPPELPCWRAGGEWVACPAT